MTETDSLTNLNWNLEPRLAPERIRRASCSRLYSSWRACLASSWGWAHADVSGPPLPTTAGAGAVLLVLVPAAPAAAGRAGRLGKSVVGRVGVGWATGRDPEPLAPPRAGAVVKMGSVGLVWLDWVEAERCLRAVVGVGVVGLELAAGAAGERAPPLGAAWFDFGVVLGVFLVGTNRGSRPSEEAARTCEVTLLAGMAIGVGVLGAPPTERATSTIS